MVDGAWGGDNGMAGASVVSVLEEHLEVMAQ